MLKPIKKHIIYPDYTITRMRYRGPIESYKINKNSRDIIKNIKMLSTKMQTEYNRLKQHLLESHCLIDNKIIISKNEEIIFNENLIDKNIIKNKFTDIIQGGKI